MPNNQKPQHHLSRRELLRTAGLGGLTMATLATGAFPLSTLAATQVDDTPEAFLATVFTHRAQAMSTGNTAGFDTLYDTANRPMLAYEKERARFYYNGLGARWGNSPVLAYEITPQLLDMKQSGTSTTARLYEKIHMAWIPPREAGQPTISRGSRGEIKTFIGNQHEIVLEKRQNTWAVVKHAYDEYCIFVSPPDLTPGSWAEIQKGGPTGLPNSGISSSQTTEPKVSAMTTYYYNRTNAVTHAHNCCNPYTYSSSYCNYNPCGGDCANFVSQCLRAGGHPPSTYNFQSPIDGGYHGYWTTQNSGCGLCGTTALYAGTDTWANNEYLRDFLNTSGRAQGVGRFDPAMQTGDVINYAWPNGCSAWTSYNDDRVDHIVIVSAKLDTAGNFLICSHGRDICDGWWDLQSDCGVKFQTFTHVKDSFNQ